MTAGDAGRDDVSAEAAATRFPVMTRVHDVPCDNGALAARQEPHTARRRGKRRPPWAECLARALRRVLAANDPLPPGLADASGALIDERRRDVLLAELRFDSAVDRGPVPRAANGLGARVLAFQVADTMLILGLEESDDATVLNGMIVAPRRYTVSLRSLGGAPVPVSGPSPRRFAYRLGRSGPVRVELASDEGAPLVQTDWVLV